MTVMEFGGLAHVRGPSEKVLLLAGIHVVAGSLPTISTCSMDFRVWNRTYGGVEGWRG